jgi:hypothetical protein
MSDEDEQNSEDIITEDDENVYRSIDITDEVYIEEFNELRDSLNIQIDIEKLYDFGLIQMDCEPFITKIVTHLNKLISYLSNYLK